MHTRRGRNDKNTFFHCVKGETDQEETKDDISSKNQTKGRPVSIHPAVTPRCPQGTDRVRWAPPAGELPHNNKNDLQVKLFNTAIHELISFHRRSDVQTY